MVQKEIEVILARHLSSYLATPIFIVDPEGNLLFYNEQAEAILGHRFNETGEMPVSEWATIFQPMDKLGLPLATDKLPAAPLFAQASGKAWNKDAWKKPMKEAAAAAGLPPGTVLYTLRHSTITDLVIDGLDLLTVAFLGRYRNRPLGR